MKLQIEIKSKIKMAKKALNKKEEINNSSEIVPGKNPQSEKLAAFWKDQIEFVEQEYKSWVNKGNQVIKRFKDERNKADEKSDRRLNVLWANIKTLKPALYGKKPIPVIERKFLQRDPVGRISATMLERSTRNQIDENGLHAAITRAVMDYLLPGRGICWVRYEPEIGNGDSLPVTTQSGVEDEIAEINKEFGDDDQDSAEENKLETTGEQVLSEQAPVDYVDWHDFLMFPPKARTWEEVQAIGKRIYISKKEAKERFKKEIAEDLKGDTTPIGKSNDRRYIGESSLFRDINERSIVIYEIWNKTDRKIYWVSPGYDYLVDVKNDFLKLRKFFPVPEPLSATLTNDSLIPVSDYYEYQDQAIQIDELTYRLALLTKACKVAGTYDASNAPLKRLLTEGVENELLPVDSWAVHAEKGGVQGGISFLPIDEIQKVIQTLQQVRQQLMQDLDLITGISDIIRGTTDSRETLGGIRLKNNNAGTRLSDRQNEVARFARDVVAIVAEIIAKHFDTKNIIEMSGILFDDEMSPEAIMAEFESAPQQNQQQGPPQQPQQPSQLPMLPGMPQGSPGSPQANIPGMGGQLGQPQQPAMGGPPGQLQPQMGNNVIPFPGNQQLQQPNAQLLQGLTQQGVNNSQVNPVEIVIQRLSKAIQLLRSDVPRNYRIEIETDSTIFGDAMQERQDAVEFISGVMQFLSQAGQVAQEIPEMTPLLGRFLQFGVRKFRVGRDLESAIDMFVRQMDKKSKEAVKNPQPSPEQMKAQSEQQKAQLTIQSQQMKNQADQTKFQMEHAAQQANDQRDFQKQQQEDQREAALAQQEIQLKEREHQLKIKEMELKHQIAMAELGAKHQQMQQQAQIQTEQNQQKIQQSSMQMAQDQQQHQQTMELSQKEHQQNVQQSQMQHTQAVEQSKLQNQQAKTQHSQKMTQMKMQSKEKDKVRKDKAKQQSKPNA